MSASTEKNDDLKEALEILRSIEFTTVIYSKCPVCLGFDKPNGETSRHHNKECKLAALLKRHPVSANNAGDDHRHKSRAEEIRDETIAERPRFRGRACS